MRIWDAKYLILIQSSCIDWLRFFFINRLIEWLIFVLLSNWLAVFSFWLLNLRNNLLLLVIFNGWDDISFGFSLFKCRFKIRLFFLSRWNIFADFQLFKSSIYFLYRCWLIGILLQSWIQAGLDLMGLISLINYNCEIAGYKT